MSIFVVDGEIGQIKTTVLPSGDLAVAGPSSGRLSQILFEVCRWHGRRDPEYGGWIVPRSWAGTALSALNRQCRKIAS